MNIKKLKNKIVILLGPTAVGKTESLFHFFAKDYEVINADSAQVYKYLDIGSAKADLKTRSIIKHHLIDIKNPDESFSVGDFIFYADKALDEIQDRNKRAVISGGTGFYIKNFLYGLANTPKCSLESREKARVMIDEDPKVAFDFLRKIDPIYANKIHENDHYRLQRALEIYFDSNKNVSSFKQADRYRFDKKPILIGLERSKEELSIRAIQRVELMIEQGLVDEIKKLKEMGASLNWQSMQSIGYKEFFLYDNLDLIKENIIKNTKAYIKRQYTYFRALKDVSWINAEDKSALEKILLTSYKES